ncbi:hypothetical protein Taro_051666 [Colocasia esculenta]|uniref:Uncharacterized protein n=1 Tax=Colocasia esculenta TaxID=4460 RepID=A0A843XHF2_COLES|nr:hypothetical protein [Colocasia esculenta]
MLPAIVALCFPQWVEAIGGDKFWQRCLAGLKCDGVIIDSDECSANQLTLVTEVGLSRGDLLRWPRRGVQVETTKPS